MELAPTTLKHILQTPAHLDDVVISQEDTPRGYRITFYDGVVLQGEGAGGANSRFDYALEAIAGVRPWGTHMDLIMAAYSSIIRATRAVEAAYDELYVDHGLTLGGTASRMRALPVAEKVFANVHGLICHLRAGLLLQAAIREDRRSGAILATNMWRQLEIAIFDACVTLDAWSKEMPHQGVVTASVEIRGADRLVTYEFNLDPDADVGVWIADKAVAWCQLPPQAHPDHAWLVHRGWRPSPSAVAL